MELETIPLALRSQLGPQGTLGLVTVFERVRPEWANDVIAISTERFERRLAEEVAILRVAIAQTEANLRVAIAEQAMRTESTLRQELQAIEKSLGSDVAAFRADLFKWSFVFWIGQVLAIAGIVGVMLRVAAS
jgi:hypothetical protein